MTKLFRTILNLLNKPKGRNLPPTLTSYTVIDLETTGLNPQFCEIIEMSAVKVENNIPTEVFTELVKPSGKLPRKITEITSITNDMLSAAPSVNVVLPKFWDFLGDDVLVGHNIDFDTDFLSIACQRLNMQFNARVVDTLALSRLCYPELSNHNLETLCDHLDVENTNAHRALSDCIATQKIFDIMQKSTVPLVRDMNYIKLEQVKNKYRTVYTPKTMAIKKLKKILQEVVSDNVLTEGEVHRLKEWLLVNYEYSDVFPFNQIKSIIEKSLEDGVLEDSELQDMLKMFSFIDKPTFCEQVTDMTKAELCGKTVCIDGDFFSGSPEEVTDRLVKDGFVVKKHMSGKVDFLIVGDLGSDDWAFDNYGNKILKAMELQFKGKDVKIIKETEFFEMLEQ